MKYSIRFAYEVTDKLIQFTDYKDIKFRSRTVFSFHRPETLKLLLASQDMIRNNMKHFPPLDETGFRKCQINAIRNLDNSFANNRPKVLVQMVTGAGKTFTAITAAYRLLKYDKMNRILFLVDTKSLGEQDVLQNGIIEQCSIQFYGLPAVVPHVRISQVDILITKVFTADFANGKMMVL